MSELVVELQETPCLTAKLPLKRTIHRFNKENASALARKAQQSRQQKLAEHAAYVAQLETEAAKAREIILANAISTKLAPAVEPEDVYRLSQLARTRECLASLYSDFSSATDAKERKFLSDAIARLSDVEFALAKRPKPAAYRTAPEKPTKRSSVVEPED